MNRLLSSMKPITYTRYWPLSMNVMMSVCHRSLGFARSKWRTFTGRFWRRLTIGFGTLPCRSSTFPTVPRDTFKNPSR